MTEPQRILEKWQLPASRLEEEVICDFTVTPLRKKLWLVMLDMALELDRVCTEHGLKFYLIGGSLLGAVRHRGFIPWDDDMDIGMSRSDYDILRAHPEWFEAPYFLQLPQTDPGCFYGSAKLRNSNTTAYTPFHVWQGINQGIGIDILPLDPWVPELGEEIYERIKALNIDNSNYMRRSNPRLDAAGRARAASWSGRDPYENLKEIERLARSFETVEDAPCLSHAVSTVDAYHSNYFPKEDLAELIRVPFEGFMLPIPAGYDHFLTQEYGNYMEFPPVEARSTTHSLHMDPDTPYKETLRRDGILVREGF
ncbi:MAG: LicD family protein [Lachnospiraceae bacterium]|nr:LicD family protein [Lachnospiraceae bacterium]